MGFLLVCKRLNCEAVLRLVSCRETEICVTEEPIVYRVIE